MSIAISGLNGKRRVASGRSPLRQAAGAVVESLEGRWLLSAGDLDLGFGTGGQVTTGLFGSTVDTSTAVAKDSSGRIVVAGNQAGTSDVIVARYLAGGALDTSFGNQGKATIDFGGSDSVGAIAIDGSNIYLAGAKGLDMAVARLTSAGALDPTFDGDGVAIVNLGAGVSDAAGAIALAPGGIFIGGTAFDPTLGKNVFAVAKFTTSGAPDGTFGAGGAIMNAIGDNAQITTLLADGSDVIAGGLSTSAGLTSFTISRYSGNTISWTDVTQFQSATDAMQNVDSQIASLANHGGQLLAIGASTDGLALAQYSLATGAPDLAFNPANALSLYPTSSYVDTSTSGMMTVRMGGLDSGGGLIVAGTRINPSPSQLGAIRYTFGLGGPARDGGYGASGIASSDVGDGAHAHTLQAATVSSADGSTVLVGDAFGPDQGSNFGGAILTGAGAVTATFNTDFTGPTTDQSTATVIDSAGRIIVAGTKHRDLDDGVVQHVVLIRYTPAGALDTTFGTNGVTEVSFGTRAETFQSLAIDGSGNILVAGLDINGAIKVARVIGGSGPTAGTLDGAFATGGILTVDGVALVDPDAAVRVAADGNKVVVAGTTFVASEDFYVRRYDANGIADTTFNGGNIVIVDLRSINGNDIARAVVVLSDSSIVVGGSSDPAFGSTDFAVVKFNSSGTVVATAFQALADNGTINALAVQGAKVVAAGQVFGTVVVARFDPVSGTFDNTFGTGGVASLDTLMTEGGAKSVAVDSNNKIALVSTLGSGELIAIRLTANGALDTAFSGDGVANTGLTSGDNDAAGVAVDAAGKIVVAGSLNVTPFNKDIAVERFLGDAPVVTVSVTVIGGVLTITGDGAANNIQVSRNAAGDYRVRVDGTIDQTFAFASVNRILINAGDGNDTVLIASNIAIPTEVHGEAGNDSLTGGGHGDMLFGEAGNDVILARGGDDILVGGDGDDYLDGGAGRDVLIGGKGADIIFGDNGDDILIAGYTSHDADPAALENIRSVWAGGGAYADRVNALKATLLKPGIDLFDDNIADFLSGDDGKDWFIANTTGAGVHDLPFDGEKKEIVTDI